MDVGGWLCVSLVLFLLLAAPLVYHLGKRRRFPD